MKFKIEHIINGTQEKVWELLWDDEFSKVLKKALNLEELETVDKKEEGDRIVIKKKVTPRITLPSTVKKLVGDRISYLEIDKLKKDEYFFDWEIKPYVLQGKVKSSGIFYLEPVGENKTRRIIEGEINIKLFGVGKSFEKLTVKNLQENYSKATQVMNEALEGK